MHTIFRNYLVEIFILEIFASSINHELYEIFLLFQPLNLEESSRELKVIAACAEDTVCLVLLNPWNKPFTFTFIYVVILFINTFYYAGC